MDSDTTRILQVIQPGLNGLMDGSVSTLAPLFATAFATRDPRTTLLIGLSAAIGAGISMAFAEVLSDTGELTGRGNPIRRGIITGVATSIGGTMHALPFLLPNLHTALYVAFAVVVVELLTIAYIRFHFFGMSLTRSIVQVIIGGGLVFLVGVIIGSS